MITITRLGLPVTTQLHCQHTLSSYQACMNKYNLFLQTYKCCDVKTIYQNLSETTIGVSQPFLTNDVCYS